MKTKPIKILRYLNFSDLPVPCGERCLYDRIKKRRENSPAAEASQSLFREEKGVNNLLGNGKQFFLEKKGIIIGLCPPLE